MQPLSTDLAEHKAAPLLRATGVSKTFDRTRALDRAGFELRAGEVHGLLGANGAGKSTLSKVISGHVMPDSGEVTFHGHPLRFRSTRDALAAGIAIVMQETSLVPDLTVLENIFLPTLGQPGRLSFPALRRRGAELLASLGHEGIVPLEAEVRGLSAAQKQLVEIAKALGLGAKLIIFDEPTASLSPSEVERLFDIMGRLRTDRRGLVFVSHRLEEVFAVTDRVTILREGRTVLASHATATLTQAELIRHMVGQELGAIYAGVLGGAERRDGPVALEVSHLEAPPLVRNISFSVRHGEILGLGGLVGAGRSEAVEAIFGLRPRRGGSVKIEGREVDIRKPGDAIRAGVGFVAEDRRSQNIVPDMSVKENLLLAHLGSHRGFGRGYAAREAAIQDLLGKLGLPPERLLDANMLNFSGGMQQKIIIARWLLLEPKILILDEPTKGVDIGTRSSIYGLLREIAEKGVAVVVVSSDFEELLGLSDRVVVISDGLSVADLPSALLDEEKLTLLATPRTSMAKNTELLRTLADQSGGAGFWALIENERLICLNAYAANPAADPGFGTGDAKTIAETRIPAALARREAEFVSEPDGERATMLVPLHSLRGHDMGWVGLTMPRGAPLPSAQAIMERIQARSGAP